MVLVVAASLLLAASAIAAPPDFLLQTPEGNAESVTGSGQLNLPRAVVADPSDGHIYVSEFGNARISEFTVWGTFVKAWGWDVAPDGAPGDTAQDELEVCTVVCKAGTPGNGAGQLNGPMGIARDAAGNLYVAEFEFTGSVHRVQKFDSDGNFLLMFGGEVNKTTDENICTQADLGDGEVCGAGVEGTADGWFSGQSIGNFIAYNPVTDSIFVGDKDRIQEFGLDGSFAAKVPLAEAGSVGSMAVDPLSGDLYFTYLIPFGADIVNGLAPQPNVHRVDPGTGAEIGTPLPVSIPRAGLAVDVDGNVYAYDDDAPGNEFAPGNHTPRILKFDADGNFVEVSKEWENNSPPGLGGLGTNVLGPGSGEPGNLYVVYFGGYLEAYGPSPIAFEDPPARPPLISAQYGASAGTNEASVRAQINPRFWDDTRFYVEYGTAPCVEGGCDKEQPVSPGALLTTKSVNKALTTPGVLLDGLEPATTYHFRFVAQSGGGGPVFGIDPDAGGPLEADKENGREGTFRTFAMPAAAPDACPANEDVRVGPSAKLPDCRGYEMVSPLDKNSGDATLIAEDDKELSQSTPVGGRFTYSARRTFGEAESGPYTSQYIASRNGAGWASEAISPLRTRLAVSLISSTVNDFQAFSEDLCRAWLVHNFRPALAEDAIEGYPNLYRRENCVTPPAYEAMTSAEPPLSKPPNRAPDLFLPLVLGFAADGSHTVYHSNGKLTAQGAALVGEIEEPQVYERVEGEPFPRLVCILPSGNPSTQPCGVGTPAGLLAGSLSNVQGATSDDGQRIVWTSFAPGPFDFLNGEPGRIFVRIEGKTTKAVSQAVSPERSWFWGASEEGSKVIFEVLEGPLADNLYEFDVDAAIAGDPEPATLIAGDVEGVLGFAATDASRLYLASREDLDAGGPGTAGEVDLYLREGGDFIFIAALAASDLSATLSPIHKLAAQRGVRLTHDGRFAAFVSTTSLTGYDNTDAVTGQPDREVFRYDSVEHELVCVSCNPTGIRPSGKSGIAAQIPGWERPTYASRVLSEDGQRLFFESYEALVPGDTNAKLDVYQWEAVGKGSCEEGDATFSEGSGGCVELISSGQSPANSRFLDASSSGDDVFIGTLSALVPGDYGLFDIYDARVGGGFPPPPVEPVCEGQACQSPPPPPTVPTPATSTSGGGASQSRPCPKGKRRVVRKGKARCVKPRKGKKQRKRSEKKGANR